ncbi:hypothetical protein LWI28_027615 [Acer negundo]|uniref:Uncharacterized protein n=1 Tax=Acer negundo TaxID=4023 RepID=A0AAD5JHZ0_ACENE|nr:hypothetical protein LWI28_027615 [Acer negundo]
MQSMETAGLAEEFGVGEALTGDGADGGARAKETDVWVDRERERGVWMKKMFGERDEDSTPSEVGGRRHRSNWTVWACSVTDPTGVETRIHLTPAVER